jgi:hypothetical protein
MPCPLRAGHFLISGDSFSGTTRTDDVVIDLQHCSPRKQRALATQPYDCWVTPAGDVRAQFFRIPDGYLLRFPDEADFEIYPDAGVVRRWPAPHVDADHIESLFNNAVLPILGNHRGGLFLHGSAVTIGGQAVAFLGLSRSGKTTLAAALAKHGHPLMTEDVIELAILPDGYQLQPKQSPLRLFADSAAYLMGGQAGVPDTVGKQSVPPEAGIAVRSAPAPLSRIYFLGQDREAPQAIRPVASGAALREMLNHSFILDVEDRQRLNAHFCRIADLSEKIPCYTLDYPRRYTELAGVLQAIIGASLGSGGTNES